MTFKRGVIFAFSFFILHANAQTRFGYSVFDKPLMGFQQLMPPQPQPASLTPAIPGFNTSTPTTSFGQVDLNKQNEALRREVDQYIERQMQEIKNDYEDDLMQLEGYRKEKLARAQSKFYRAALAKLSGLNPDSFSLAKAVYLVENAFFDERLLEETFLNNLKEKATFVRQILKSEGLSAKENDAVNYAIQKLFARQSSSYTATAANSGTSAFSYDFEDYKGEKDYTKMFVSKLLMTGKGQCHSLPLAYLLIAEQLGAKAQLSFAPQHTFIQFQDKNGKRINFEATNGHLVSANWIMQSGYITSLALQKKTYLNALTNRQLFAHIVADLLLGYLSKYPYDEFAEQIRQKVIQVNPANLTAMIVDANVKTLVARDRINAVGKPKEADLPKYPEAFKAYLAMQAAYEKVDATGFQDMPPEAYQKWLQSFDKMKKQANNGTKSQTVVKSQGPKKAS